MSFEVPHQIDVCGYAGPASWAIQKVYNHIQPTTAMFRGHSDIGRVLQIAALAAPDEPLEIISAGCSIGAEIDTALALANLNMPDRSVHVLGIDEDDFILDDASAGIYHLLSDPLKLQSLYAIEGVDFDEHLASYGMRWAHCLSDGYGILDATSLRDTYPVELAQADMMKTVPAERLAHLALLQNVAYHHDPETATDIVVNLAENVAIGGLISLGIVRNRRLRMGPTFTLYNAWQAFTSGTLQKMGFEPAGHPDDLYSAFKRTS